MKKILLYISLVILFVGIAGTYWLSNSNNFKRSGELQIGINEQPITIHRDDYGIPYIFAESKADLIRGQGFVIAQDRLFQIEFYRALIKGELSQLIGPSMLSSDIQMRVLNLEQLGKNSYQHLNKESRDFLHWYCQGFNAYLQKCQDEFPLELSLLGMTPTIISSEELMMVIHFIGLNHGQNMGDEILSLNLAARTDFAEGLFPLNTGPDRTKTLLSLTDSLLLSHSEAAEKQWPSLAPTLLPLPKLGSNNYALAAEKSKSGKVIVCNDPHLDARLLPGIFHPVGLFCPDFKGVGLAIPGIPGLVIGRNEYVAFGVTNAYGDSQDLVIEKTSGDHYHYQGELLPFEKRKELIAIKDSTAVEIEIRSTVHGPIISDFAAFGIMTTDIVSLQWSQAASHSPSLGVERFLEATTIFEFREALFGIDNMFFNYVFGDVEGNIAHQTTGLVPKRVSRQGQVPQAYGEQPIWDEFIPKNEMPHSINTERGWVGTANHDTRPDDYPYYYSSHFSPDYRFKRLQEVFDGQATFGTDELWQLILDCKNMQAEQLAPLFATALSKEQQTSDLAAILQSWNHQDKIDEIGPTVYHAVFDQLLNLILDDELPDELEEAFWKNNYYWSQRIDSIILADHPLVDNQSTPQRESLDELIVQAGLLAQEQLRDQLGDDMQTWEWGSIHTVQFSSPIRQEGLGSEWCGGELLPKDGSNQTLNRGGYAKTPDGSFETGWFSTFRMVADLSDDEKIMGALSGGSSARVFHPYYKSQLDTWKTNDWIPYWLSKEKVQQHSKFELVLE